MTRTTEPYARPGTPVPPSAGAPSPGPRTVAFYLPQFHAIPENDAWWGEGFTEWTNVRRAAPLFDGHEHPRRPGALGTYDLTDPSVVHEQARLAADAGVDAFCMYFYWFDGHRLLEKPLDAYLAAGPDFPFCLSWANENWTRRWDGKDQEVLIGQDYREETPEEVFAALAPYLSDPRYLRQDGAAVLLVHRADHLPDGDRYARVWRAEAERRGIGALYLVAAETTPGLDPRPLGFDAVAEFPPVGANTLAAARLRPVDGLTPAFRGRLLSYPRMAGRFERRRAERGFVRHSGVMPGWDNTARRGDAATVYVDSSPARYAAWLRSARARERRIRGGRGLVFVNAWNEWAEGAYLEPDATYGSAYLEATRPEGTDRGAPPPAVRSGRPGRGYLRSLLNAGMSSGLAWARVSRRLLQRAAR